MKEFFIIWAFYYSEAFIINFSYNFDGNWTIGLKGPIISYKASC